ncbi:hypothetical protein [Streptomyces sp. NPDC008092]|uniref:hypothetical protein n=1 Tax=Streptomyces sp. NPDC008092 TaxID=3364808 RepID=UPI0036F099D1
MVMTKVDVPCNSEIIKTGTTRLVPVNQPQFPLAMSMLEIDATAPTMWSGVDFDEITMYIDLLEPQDAQLVEVAQVNYFWGTPDGSGGWTEAPNSPLPPTRNLRIRARTKHLVVNGTNGISFHVGIHYPEGQVGAPLTMHVHTTAKQVVAATSGCGITFSEFKIDDSVTGPLG